MKKTLPRIKGAFDHSDRPLGRDQVMRLIRAQRRSGNYRYIREKRIFRFINFFEPFAIRLDGKEIAGAVLF